MQTNKLNLCTFSISTLKIDTKINFKLPGSLSFENVRERLKAALKSKDKKLLDATIKESVSAGFPGLDVDIQEARETLFKLEGGKGG